MIIFFKRYGAILQNIARVGLNLFQLYHLQHPNIARFIGIVIEPSNNKILMEYCPRGSLQVWISISTFVTKYQIAVFVLLHVNILGKTIRLRKRKD